MKFKFVIKLIFIILITTGCISAQEVTCEMAFKAVEEAEKEKIPRPTYIALVESKQGVVGINEAIKDTKYKAVIVKNDGDYTGQIKIKRENISVCGEKNKFPKIVFRDNEEIISIEGNKIIFDGFEVTNGEFIKTKGISVGVSVKEGSRDITVSHNKIHTIGRNYKACKCHGDAHGIYVNSYDEYDKKGQLVNISSPISGVKIVGNTISDLHLGKSEAITLNGKVSDFKIEENSINDIDNIAIDIGGFQNDVIGGEKQGKLQNWHTNNGTVIHNAVWMLNSGNPGQEGVYPFIAGIYIDGGSQTVIERNIVYKFGVGIKIGSEGYRKSVENIDVINNIIFDSIVSDISIGKFEGIADEDKDIKTQRGFIINCKIVNNTILGKNDGLEEKYAVLDFASGKICDKEEKCAADDEDFKPNLKDILIANNIILTEGERKIIGITDDEEGFPDKDLSVIYRNPDVKFINNLFWGSEPEKLKGSWNGKDFYINKLSFQNILNNKAENLFEDPIFEPKNDSGKCIALGNDLLKEIQSKIPKFILGKTSHAIDTGDNSAYPIKATNSNLIYPDLSGAKDFCGNHRVTPKDGKIDIGAFEYQQ